jgi:hypothetical protein
MKFTTSEVVRGFSNMAYNIDGQSAQVKVIYIDVELNAEHGGKGTRTDAKQVADPKVIEDALAQRSFPCVCELDFEERATKGKVTLVCTAIRAKVVDPMQRKAA